MKKRGLIVLLIAGLLTGCAVGPDYRRPNVRTPDVFRGGTDQRPPADPASLADLRWFELFKDLQLQDLIREALAQNFDLREAVARISAARANVGIVRSEQFPNFAVSSDIVTVRSSASGATPLPEGIERETTFGSVLLNLLSFELDIWGRLRRQTEAARAQFQASVEDRRAVMTVVVGDVAAGYFSLLELDRELEIARRTLATREDSLRLIRVRQRGGVATMMEVRQAEQLVYSAAQVIPDTERLIEQTENQISLLLGRDPGPIPRGRSLTEQEQPVEVPPGLPSSLLTRRPDIRAAEQNLIAANANIGVARAAYFPQISLTGFLGTESDQLTNMFSDRTRVWQFVPQLSLPIFTAGGIRSNVRFTEAQRQVFVVQYERAIRTAFREVSDALAQYRRVREIRVQQELLVRTLQDRSRLAYLRYRGGVDTLLNALDADRDLFAAELNLARTLRDELFSLVQLYRALGGGWE